MNKPINKKQIEQVVEESLHSLDGIQRATPAPYLLTRIRARMQSAAAQENSPWFKIASLLSRPWVAIACLVLLLVVNFLAINLSGNNNINTAYNTIAQQKDDYALGVISIYESEPNEP